MAQKENMDRRTMFKIAGAAGIGLVAAGTALKAEASSELSFKNEDFYNAGKFDPEKAKDAYIALMKYHGYFIFEGLRERLWVSDYGIGTFTQLGLGAIGFINDEESGYLGQDLFLLPGQMLPEHYHVATDKCPPKMEGWHVRNGCSYVYGEGEPTKNMYAKIPESQKDIVSTFHETILNPGQTATLHRQTAKHWQFGGPEGAIVSEYGTFHDNDGVRHSDPKLVFP